MTPASTSTVHPGRDAATPALRGHVVAIADLDRRQRDAMFGLLGAHFVGASRDVFEADLAEKTCALLLADSNGALRGFSTLLVFETAVAGRRVQAVYSGDTIVERGWWRSPALATSWLRAIWRFVPDSETVDLYWLLLTSGYRTYRFLPVFFREFLPHHDAGAPAEWRGVLDGLATARFGHRYDRAEGIVRFDRPQVLVPELANVPPGRARDPHVAFFLRRNPGHVLGDELACLTRIHRDNLTGAGRRMVRLASAE